MLAHYTIKDLYALALAEGEGMGTAYEYYACLLYTSDAADERSSVDLGGRRIIKKKNHICGARHSPIGIINLTTRSCINR